MHLAEWLAVAAIVVAIVIGVVTFVATRAGVRRRRVLVAIESVPLLPQTGGDGLLAVTFRGIEMSDPHLLTVRLRNLGPSDIGSQHFDSGTPLVVRTNCVMLGVTRSSPSQSTVSSSVGAEGVIQLPPRHIPRNGEWLVEAVVEGVPVVELESPLLDTDLVYGPRLSEEVSNALSGMALSLPLGITLQFRGRSSGPGK